MSVLILKLHNQSGIKELAVKKIIDNWHWVGDNRDKEVVQLQRR